MKKERKLIRKAKDAFADILLNKIEKERRKRQRQSGRVQEMSVGHRPEDKSLQPAIRRKRHDYGRGIT